MRLRVPGGWRVNEVPEKCYDDRFVTEADFKRIGSQLLSKTQHPYDISDEDMVYYYGATPLVLVRLWKDLVVKTGLPKTSKPIHLLWWMALVKNYPTRRSFAKFTKVSATTLRKWMKKIARRMIVLLPHVIKWENRLRYDKNRTCKTYHDGVDCRIHTQKKKNGRLDKSFSSHKFAKKSGLRYGISSCIQTGDIVGVFGPFPAGSWPDSKIYKHYVVPKLSPNEMVEVDKGYWHPTCRRPGNYLCTSEKLAKCKVAGRHETINGRIKNFRSTDYRFRHNIHDHKHYFFTACIVTQMMFEEYGTTFDTSY